MLYHVVLLKLKPEVTEAQVAEITALAKAMLGVVPGLKSLEMGPPLASTAQRAQGFNLGLLAVLESEEHLAGYATHPAHVKVNELRVQIAADTLAYDLQV